MSLYRDIVIYYSKREDQEPVGTDNCEGPEAWVQDCKVIAVETDRNGEFLLSVDEGSGLASAAVSSAHHPGGSRCCCCNHNHTVTRVHPG